MEANPTSSSYGERGAGGKLRRPSARKSQATPYDRPPSSQQGRGGWLSKLVDPAYRIVASGATKLLPSFFSGTAAALPPPPENLDDEEELEATPNAESNERSTPVTERSDEPNDTENNIQCSEIEQMIKMKSFTSDEINRLVEMLNSKGNESAVEGNKRTDVLLNAGKSVEDMPIPVTKVSDKGKQKDLQNVAFRSPMPVSKTAPGEIGASPIEIARAYMGRLPEYGPGSSRAATEGETDQQLAHEVAPTPLIPSSAPRLSTTCWPGSMGQQQMYTTPNPRDRRQPHDFPRTPYSRTVYSKSTIGKSPQMQTHSKYTSSSPNHFKQSQTPIFEKVNYGNDRLDNSYGSAGPIRRLRMKYAPEVRQRESIFSKNSESIPSGNGQSVVSHGKQFGSPSISLFGETSTSRQQPELLEGSKVGSINPAAEELVKKKINQLGYHMATPQQKTNELEIASARRKSPTEDLSSHKRMDFIDPKLTSKGNTSGGNSNSQGDVQQRDAVAREIVNASIKAPSEDNDSVMKSGVSTAPSLSLRSPLFQPTSLNEKSDHSIPPMSQSSEQLFTTGFELLKKPPLHTPGTRPNLSHISVGRRDTGRPDNGLGFTFPVSTSSSALSEPPTPSVMPFLTGEVPSQPKELPVYTFDTNKSTPRLAFSFASTSNVLPKVDEQDLKFNFGSDKKRVSFSPAGKDAICY